MAIGDIELLEDEPFHFIVIQQTEMYDMFDV
jgi:hypothetical protein